MAVLLIIYHNHSRGLHSQLRGTAVMMYMNGAEDNPNVYGYTLKTLFKNILC